MRVAQTERAEVINRMGIFDFFAKELPQTEETRRKPSFASAAQPINMRSINGGALQVFKPRSFGDVEKIINTLRDNKPVIVYLNEIKQDIAQRVLDLLSGAIFALDGGVFKVEDFIYVFTPEGVNINESGQ